MYYFRVLTELLGSLLKSSSQTLIQKTFLTKKTLTLFSAAALSPSDLLSLCWAGAAAIGVLRLLGSCSYSSEIWRNSEGRRQLHIFCYLQLHVEARPSGPQVAVSR